MHRGRGRGRVFNAWRRMAMAMAAEMRMEPLRVASKAVSREVRIQPRDVACEWRLSARIATSLRSRSFPGDSQEVVVPRVHSTHLDTQN